MKSQDIILIETVFGQWILQKLEYEETRNKPLTDTQLIPIGSLMILIFYGKILGKSRRMIWKYL